ncbi:hypothetical protein LG200_12500 [Methylobacillus caricis]|uniref:pilus assembly PilX family protein n=1 Tax=Methylobacillus caricis TaxID=1971611 RepID=UPI001CFF9819|nr:hypothetical protein [Methylobacillus caricis]MCB5188822.1 hypothetical protein [Methylobacillus caricis]
MKTSMRTHHALSRQRGVVLMVALVVLIAMTLAGLALWRAVDSGNVIAGNLAFKQSATMSADRGLQAALVWLDNNRNALHNNNLPHGYIANTLITEPDWYSNAIWNNAVDVGTDAASNRVQYLIHRLCTTTGAYNGEDGAGQVNNCSTSLSKSPATNANAGNGIGVDSPAYSTTPSVYYRITVRVLGPRNTTSIVQATVMVPV